MSDQRNREERRRYIRYSISGSLELESDGQRYTGFPMNLSLNGVRFTTDPVPPIDLIGSLRLVVDGFYEVIAMEARVVRVGQNEAAAVFLLSPTALIRCIALLGQS